MKTNTYTGSRPKNHVTVLVNGRPLVNPTVYANGRPIKFGWGHRGKKSRQLAWAILRYEFDGAIAEDFHGAFTSEVVAFWRGTWTITSYALNEWLIRTKAKRSEVNHAI